MENSDKMTPAGKAEGPPDYEAIRTGPPDSEEVIRFKIALAARMLFRNGCDSGIAGTISVRVPGEEAFWSLAVEYFDAALPDHTAKLSMDLKQLAGKSIVPNVMMMNRAIYRARPDVAAIVHLHSRYLSAVGTRHQPVALYNFSALMFHANQAVLADDGMARGGAADMFAPMATCDAAIMPYHGSINLGPSLEMATSDAILYEGAALAQLDAEAAGGTPIEDASMIRNRALRPMFRQIMWDRNADRARLSDPDLFAHQPPVE